jgi:phosphodiesterase/alkaline phosphatase D-like protein
MTVKNDRSPRLVVGHLTHESARIWGRGDAQHPYMFVNAAGEDGTFHTAVTPLSPEDGYSGVTNLEGLRSGTEYKLEVSYGKTARASEEERVLEREGQFETFPTPGEDKPFSLLLNSCNFHGWGPFHDNDKANVKRAEVARGVDMVLHTGDQVYADKAPISFSLGEFRSAYDKAWSDRGVPEVLSSQANYMLPDDHEVVNGFQEGGRLTRFQRLLLWARGHGKPAQEQYAELGRNGLKAFREFQRSHGPDTYGADVNYYTFAHGRHQFFAMDTGLNRNADRGEMISAAQKQALFDWLKEHREQPKFVITSTPFVMEYKNPHDKWTSPEWAAQRDEIIDFLGKEKLDNVVFLAGDVHASGHARLTIQAPDGQDIVIDELTASPINASVMRGRDKFVGHRSGRTQSGTGYQVSLDEESFLGKEGFGFNIGNSNVMKIEVDGDNVRYEIHRTRKDDDGPIRSGQFNILD